MDKRSRRGLDRAAAELRASARSSAFKGHEKAAITKVDQALSLAPWSTDAWLLRARVHPVPDYAIERAVALSPVRASARELRARMRLENGDARGAYADLRMAARLHPVRPEYAEAAERLKEKLQP